MNLNEARELAWANQEQKIRLSPRPDNNSVAAEQYHGYVTFQPRIQSAFSGLTSMRAFLWDGYKNWAWQNEKTTDEAVFAPYGEIRGFTYGANLQTPAMPYAVSHTPIAGSAPHSGIYTGVDDENC